MGSEGAYQDTADDIRADSDIVGDDISERQISSPITVTNIEEGPHVITNYMTCM